MRLHIVAALHRPDALAAASEAAAQFHAAGDEIGFERETARALGVDAVPSEQFAQCDLVIAFGGDGTLIRAAHLCANLGTPILGVYFGRFGFVTQCTAGELVTVVESFRRGETRLERRLMLQAELRRAGNTVATLFALNEITLQRTVTARMMTFRVSIDGRKLTSYPADGVLVSTPTGSTAYNLSAGGPILDPNIEAFVLTAIAPHTLSSRPLVIRPDSVISLRISSDGDAVLSSDSQTRLHILSNDEVRITRSPLVTNLVSVKPDDFLHKLGQRLFWSKGLVGSGE